MRWQPGYLGGGPTPPTTFAQLALFSTFFRTTSSGPGGTYTFTNTTVGSASTDRLVVVAAWARSGGAIGSATINSSPATILVQNFVTAGNLALGLFQMALPTTQTAVDIAFATATTAPIKGAIAVWTLRGLASHTATTFGQTTSQTSSVPTIALDRPDGGVGIAAGWNANTATIAWQPPFTQSFNTTTGFAADGITGAAMQATSASTVSAIFISGSSNANSMVAAVWA
jgi:hypothetical protein